MIARTALALGLVLSLAAAAQAQEVVKSSNDARADPTAASNQVPPPGVEVSDPDANGAWARDVLARADDPKTANGKQAACVRNPDRAPHGETWVSAGSRGYSDYGVVATQPIGDCWTVTMGFEQSQGGGYGYAGGRRGR